MFVGRLNAASNPRWPRCAEMQRAGRKDGVALVGVPAGNEGQSNKTKSYAAQPRMWEEIKEKEKSGRKLSSPLGHGKALTVV